MTNRRQAMKLGLAGSLSLLGQGKTAWAQPSTQGDNPANDSVADVVIVGAGFAGAAAARMLFDAGKHVILVEARERLGGRTYTKTMESGAHRFDVGGIWIGPTQRRCIDLVKKFNIDIFATYNRGMGVLDNNGTISHYEGVIPKLNPLALADFSFALDKLDALATTVNMNEPWTTPDAFELDSLTIANWVAKHTWTETSRKLLLGAMEQLLSADPRRVSLLHTLFFLKSAGGIDRLVTVEGGAQQYRFSNGTTDLIHKMVEPFSKNIRLSSPVRAISQSETNVVVTCDNNVKIRARRVIVALAPTLAGRIDYSPLVSPERDHLCQTMPMGSVIKFFAVYNKPFWRERNLSGQIVSLNGPIFSTFDNTLENSTEGVLVGFLVGGVADRMRKLDGSERKRQVIDHLKMLFGNEAGHPTFYFEHDWATERYSRGCFLGYLPTGIWTSIGASLWKPEGRIHWAGTETAREWNGYIEGALESGQRAASEVLAAL